jgi:hypothetical protein
MAPLIVFGTSGCRQLLGVDDYQVAPGEPARDSCAPAGVPASRAGAPCEPVGVKSCPSGSTLQSGGCVAVLPDAPCEKGSERLGLATCDASSMTVLCHAGHFPPPPQGALQYVDASFKGPGPDGSESAPWATISDALTHVEPGGAVLVAAGQYDEDLLIDKPGVRLLGVCPGQVIIRGTGLPPMPGYACAGYDVTAGICVTADNALLDRLDVTGAGDGIAIVGAKGVTLNFVSVSSTGRYGVRIEAPPSLTPSDAQRPASVDLQYTTIDGAHGAGLYVAGSTITSTTLIVRRTASLNGYLGYGVSVRPGGFGTIGADGTPAPDWPRSDVSLDGAVLVANADAALLVSGSTVRVKDGYLGNLSATDPTGPGVIVERDVPRGYPADLTMTSTIVQRTRDAAIDVNSATVTLEDVTLRDTFGRSGDGCSGQGIRARTHRGTQAQVTLRRSLIDGSRQAAIHAHGAQVTVDHSILRNAAPREATKSCAPHLGDGVTLNKLANAETSLTLDHSRIDGNARAAVASFGGAVTTKGSVLACNGRGLVSVDGAPVIEGTLCGCEPGLLPCSAEHASLEPWVSPGAASGHTGAVADFKTTVATFLSGAALTTGMAWLLEAPEVTPALPDSAGCATLTGVPDLPSRRIAIWQEGNQAALAQVTSSTSLTCAGADLTTGALQFAGLYSEDGIVDLNRGFVFAISPTDVTQTPKSGSPWFHFGGSLSATNPVRANVEPGWYKFEGAGLACTKEILFSGAPVPGSTTARRVLVEPGMIGSASFRGCVPVGSCGTDKFEDPSTGQCSFPGTAAVNACADQIVAIKDRRSVSAYSPDCAACLCQSCLPHWSWCINDRLCSAFLACAMGAGCQPSSPDCQAQCATELAAAGGNNSPSAWPASSVDRCDRASGCTACPF